MKKTLDEGQLRAKERVETNLKTTGEKLVVGVHTYDMMEHELGKRWTKKHLTLREPIEEGEVAS